MNRILRVKCPQCDTIFSYYESEFRPFCSERCKMIDLGHWFEESYRVPSGDKNQSGQNNEHQENENEPENYEQIHQEDEEYDENDYE
ncbi:MAG: DNA gyrase inhibitor YacG [Bacteriovorax sp.]